MRDLAAAKRGKAKVRDAVRTNTLGFKKVHPLLEITLTKIKEAILRTG